VTGVQTCALPIWKQWQPPLKQRNHIGRGHERYAAIGGGGIGLGSDRVDQGGECSGAPHVRSDRIAVKHPAVLCPQADIVDVEVDADVAVSTVVVWVSGRGSETNPVVRTEAGNLVLIVVIVLRAGRRDQSNPPRRWSAAA